jgi:hypothetical protein
VNYGSSTAAQRRNQIVFCIWESRIVAHGSPAQPLGDGESNLFRKPSRARQRTGL